MRTPKKYFHPFPLLLESGKTINKLEITYNTYGKYNPEANNVIWVCNALTATSDVFEWWPGLFGENDYFNPSKHFIVSMNILGSCYGTTGPLSIDPKTGEKYYHNFPAITVRDMVQVHELLRNHLGIKRINTVIGASLGGQQAIEWSIFRHDVIDNLVLLATNAFHSAWGIAFNEAQRMAIEADETWKNRSDDAGLNGLKAARAVALLSYRGYIPYTLSQSEVSNDKTDDFKASSYQQYQGTKLAKRFNAFSYWILSKAMDSHNVARGRKGIHYALRQVRAKTFIIGIRSDILFPIEEQKFLAKHIPHAYFSEISSDYGHDGFLIETAKLQALFERLKIGSDIESSPTLEKQKVF
jgi:homoserine O-acetyltransferase/O-succinyltransferase